jgi:membrane-bound serine protease (ClpP class)
VVSVSSVDVVAPVSGRAFVEGAWWSVRSVGPPLVEGGRARVVGMSGLELAVEPESPRVEADTREKEDTS